MAGLPWVRFFPSDWLAGTRGMTAAETGVYINLLMMMYERRGPIADNPGRLARLCGASNSSFAKILDQLVSDGKIQRADGLWAPIIDAWTKVSREAIPIAVRQEVEQRDGKVCRYCGDSGGPFELDHVHPWSAGGLSTTENLVVACRACNRSKGAKPVTEWLS